MARDVFISHSSSDAQIAEEISCQCEAQGVGTWIAPRNVPPGADWAKSIVDAIGSSRAMVLVFSAHANGSPQVCREAELAIKRRILVIPFRIENRTPSGSMEYFLSACHWLDAFPPPIEPHARRLAHTVVSLFEKDGDFLGTLNKVLATVESEPVECMSAGNELIDSLFKETQVLVDDYFNLFRSARTALTKKRGWFAYNSSAAAREIRERREALLTTRLRVREWAKAVRESDCSRLLADFASSIRDFFYSSQWREDKMSRSDGGKLVDLFHALGSRDIRKGELDRFISRTLNAMEGRWQAIAFHYARLKQGSTKTPRAHDG